MTKLASRASARGRIGNDKRGKNPGTKQDSYYFFVRVYSYASLRASSEQGRSSHGRYAFLLCVDYGFGEGVGSVTLLVIELSNGLLDQTLRLSYPAPKIRATVFWI